MFKGRIAYPVAMSEENPENKAIAFLESKYAVPTGIALALVISVFLLIAEKDGSLCMATLIMAIAAYIIPKNFGLKDLKWISLWGVAFIVFITTVAFAFTFSYYDSNPDNIATIEGGPLTQGTVFPMDVADDGNYTYNVIVSGNVSNVTVHIGVINAVYLEAKIGEVIESIPMTNTSVEVVPGGYFYEANATLAAGENYYFYFTADQAGEEVRTGDANGPITRTGPDAWLFYWSQNFTNLFFLVAMPFYFLAFISWWMKKNIERAIEKMEEQGRVPPRDGRPCVKCGTPLSKDAEVCPGCGRIIPQYIPPQMPTRPEPEPEEDETFICSDCGAEVPEDADVCPSCGERFDE